MADEHHHETPRAPTPIGRLIDRKLREQGLRPADLVRRMGFADEATGLRILDCAHLESIVDPHLRARLAIALGCPQQVVERALELGEEELAERRRKEERAAELRLRDEARCRALAEAASRPAFVPHAIIETEHRVPSPIFVAAILGPDRLRRIDFDLSRPSRTFFRQALATLPGKLRGGQVPCFGRPTGIIVNYSPNRSVRFDLEGRAIEIRSGTSAVGSATLSVDGKPLPENMLKARLVGGNARRA